MRNHRYLCWILLVGLGVLGADLGNPASADIHSFVAVRQELRAELLACMSDGQLDQHERSLLERKAAGKLSPGALAAFRKTLDRMVRESASAMEWDTAQRTAPTARPLLRANHQATLEPTMPATWSEPEPEVPVLEGAAVSEADVALVEDALGDEYWEADSTVFETPSVERAGSPLIYTSRVANDMLAEEMAASGPPAIFSGNCCEAAGCETGCCDAACGVAVGCETVCLPACGGLWGLDWIQFSATADAFQGPMDLDGINGNFGVRFAVNAALPLSRAYGIGVQAGTSGGMSDFHGTQFTGSRIRSQNFTTVGLFQRLCLGQGAVKYGFAFDWLFDDYYANFTLSQWRVKLGWEVSPVAEIGLWASIPNDGDDALLGAGTEYPTVDYFKPFAQGNLYWTRCWLNGTTTTAYVGIAAEPGEWVFGGNARIPMGGSLAVVGNLHYILPSADGWAGQEEEVWNLGLGFEWTPGPCANQCCVGKFSPLFRLADNGTMAVRRY